MARLLFRGEWFDAVLPDAVYEIDYEEQLLAQSPHLYPGFHLVRFKQLLDSEYGRGRPDLALIDKSYRTWWIIEVELGTHSLRQHVGKQVAIFSTARYGRDTADYLADSCIALDRAALREMMLGSPPRVLVLVNQAKPEWAPELARWGALVGVVEVFRDGRNNVVLRVNGDHPTTRGAVLSSCHVDPSLPKSLVVGSPASLGVESGERVVLWFAGGITEWKRIDTASTVWLMPVRRCPLQSQQRYFDIVRSDDSRLVLEPRSLQRKRRAS